MNIDPITAVLGAGDLLLAVIAGAAIWSGARWQDRACSLELKVETTEQERTCWEQIAKDNGADALRIAQEASALRAKLRGHEAVAAEPKLIRIPKGQPGAGRFVPNPNWKAELTA